MVTLVEPTGFSTDRSGPSSVRAERKDVYDGVCGARERLWAERRANAGDPQAAGPAILAIVDADEPPLRVYFGAGTLDMIRASRIETWERWNDLAVAAHGGQQVR